MAWLLLVAAGLLEIVWAIALKYADGFTRLWPSVLTVVAAALSFVLLSIAMRHLPVGTAYAVWVGVGALGVAAVGIAVLGESASPARLGCLLLVLTGIIGLKLVEG
jgi:quaternary ammonium compound-resistance protein SugE